jgi:enterochelin esterase family protein
MLINELHVNAALYETAVAFDPQLPMGGGFIGGDIIPAGIEFIRGNKAVLRFHAPNANNVVVRLGYSEGPAVEMVKQQDGVWTATIDSERAKYSALFFMVDGVYVLNPMAPIGWSHAHPINIIDFPDESADYYLLKNVPHGTVARDYYFSKTCGCYKSCLVYTPPDYTSGKWDSLPVLYLQHGYGENETSWVHLGKVNWIMDNLLEEGKAEPCVIVMNNGMVQTEHSNGSRDWEPMAIEKLLLDDCIPYIEKHYRVASDKWRRAMAGLSMGSMQTSVTTLKHPELFGYAGIFSGFLGMIGGQSKNENSHFAAFDDKQKLFESYKLFFRCIGDADQFIGQFNSETAMLKEKGLAPEQWKAHKEVFYPGGHDWNVWRPCVRDFLALVFK